VLLARLRALFERPRLERELDLEIAAHLEELEAEGRASGLPADEARRYARRRFGAVEGMKEEHRDARSARLAETLAADLRYGLVSLRRDPGFTATAVSVLALGIGASAAMFGVLDAVLLKPLPFPEPERIVTVLEAPAPGARNSITTLNFVDWQRLNTVFEALSAEEMSRVGITIGGEPVPFLCGLVSADYFRVFGVDAQLGRTFARGEDQPGAPAVVVLSHLTWRTRFASDPAILSRELLLDGRPHRVVGVLPPGPFDRGLPSLWKPLVFAPEQLTRGHHWLGAVARLRKGVSLAEAREGMRALSARLAEVNPPWKKDWGVAVDPYAQQLVGDRLRRSVLLAFGAVVLVLLVACANVANLLLAKGATRHKEMTVRAALGASRGRLVAQLLTEGLVLSVLGSAAGVALAFLLVRAAVPLFSLPAAAEVGVDLRVLAFSAALALTVTLLIGVVPSLRASSVRLSPGAHLGTRGVTTPRERLRRTIVVAEVAASLVLVSGAMLLFKSLLQASRQDPGVTVERVVTAAADLSMSAYPTAESATAFYRTVVERIEAAPQVERAAVSSDLPFQGVRGGEFLQLPGREDGVGVRFKRVGPGYFEALDIRLQEGRRISPDDRAGAPAVAVINQELARRLEEKLGVTEPVGTTVLLSCPRYVKQQEDERAIEIVGVIKDERVADPHDPPSAVFYVTLAQVPRPKIKLVVRTRGEPEHALPAIRGAVAEVDPHLALADVRTLAQVRTRSLAGMREPAEMIGVFAAGAALLAAFGLYGVLSHLVTQRRGEIGIRMALGARPADVLGHVLRDASWMLGVGLALGILGSLALTRVMAGALVEVSPLDPAVFLAACVLMALVGLAAGFVPARRAARVAPADVLRNEG
jgi:putative ABC transport system permease protein